MRTELARPRRRRESGNAMVEFALIGIPIMFLLLITFETARVMWQYHTMAYAVREGVRYAVVHGHDCSVPPNNCGITRADVANRVLHYSLGLIPADLQLAFGASGSFADINTYKADTSPFPDSSMGARFLPLELRIRYTVHSPLGALLTAGGPGSYTFVANSRELIQY